MFEDEILDIFEIVKGRYTSSKPKTIYIVQTGLFDKIHLFQFDIVKIENNLIYGWRWLNNKKIKYYETISVNFCSLDSDIKPFSTINGAKEYKLWLIMQGKTDGDAV